MNIGKSLNLIPIEKIYIGMNVISENKDFTGVVKYINQSYNYILLEWYNCYPTLEKHERLQDVYYLEK